MVASRRRHPQDRVHPVASLLVETTTELPQSQRQLNRVTLFRRGALLVTRRRPKRWPVRSRLRLTWMRHRPHASLLLAAWTVLAVRSLPHSQRSLSDRFSLFCHVLSRMTAVTVQRPNF